MVFGFNYIEWQYGIEQEKKIKPELEKKFGSLKEPKTKYSKFDFFNDNYFIEIKSRKCKSSLYDTSLLPAEKIDEQFTQQVFVFNFIDCVKYIYYDKEKFNKFTLKIFNRNSNYPPKFYYYIPLTEMETL